MNAKPNQSSLDLSQPLFSEGYQQAVRLLCQCSSPDGFLASNCEHDNYHRIWARDGVIAGLAGLLSQNDELIHAMRATLCTLAKYQGPHGEIPSNVDTRTERVSYGGTTGRVDANLWFIIGCAEYWHYSQDEHFLTELVPQLEKTRFLLGAWEFNNRGLLYIPQAGDWADEYLHSGYILYDQLLYLQAQRSLASLHEAIHGSRDHVLLEKLSHLKHLITSNYWLNSHDPLQDDIYHEVLYRQAHAAAPHCAGEYWLPCFSPTGYGYRFDSFANILVSLLGVSNTAQSNQVDEYIDSIINQDLPLLPAFHPVIQPLDEDWKHLQMTFSYTFKNKPFEFHNGGLWAMLTGFYVADLQQRGKITEATKYLAAIHQANKKHFSDDESNWGFAEYIHGRTLMPGGTRQQAWSAAAAIIGHAALHNKQVFSINDKQRFNTAMH